MEVYDKNKHGDEFRLRLLLTDACNLKCQFCLNDFQGKPKYGYKFLHPTIARDYIGSYSYFVGENCSHVPLVNISGGEPGLHPDLLEIVEACSEFKVHLMLNTNGLVFKHRDWSQIAKHVGHLRVHVHPCEFIPYNEMGVNMPMSFQAVYTNPGLNDCYEGLINYYSGRGGCVKFFVDFNGDEFLNKCYEDFIIRMRRKYPNTNIEARFTGIQQNRGDGCRGCKKKCITLKALWVFPDGKATPCPQGKFPSAEIPFQKNVENAYEFHRLDKEMYSQGGFMAALGASMEKKRLEDAKKLVDKAEELS